MKRIRALVVVAILPVVLSSTMSVRAQDVMPVKAEEFVLVDSESKGNLLPVQPMWVTESRATCSLSVSGKKLTASVRVLPKSSSLSTTGTLYIERKDSNRWVQVASVSVSGSGYCTGTKTYTGTSGKTYRARYSGKTGTDSVSSTSNEATVR